MGIAKMTRTYPQPDAPELGSSPRNRALAVFKYLPELNLEPEVAKDHPLFKVIEHAFAQEANAACNEATGGAGGELRPSLIQPIQASEREINITPVPTTKGKVD